MKIDCLRTVPDTEKVFHKSQRIITIIIIFLLHTRKLTQSGHVICWREPAVDTPSLAGSPILTPLPAA